MTSHSRLRMKSLEDEEKDSDVRREIPPFVIRGKTKMASILVLLFSSQNRKD